MRQPIRGGQSEKSVGPAQPDVINRGDWQQAGVNDPVIAAITQVHIGRKATGPVITIKRDGNDCAIGSHQSDGADGIQAVSVTVGVVIFATSNFAGLNGGFVKDQPDDGIL